MESIFGVSMFPRHKPQSNSHGLGADTFVKFCLSLLVTVGNSSS